MKNRNIIKYFKTMVFTFICLFAVSVMNVNAETRSVTDHSELDEALLNDNVDVVKLANDITAEDFLTFRIEPGSVTTKTLDLNGNTLDLGSGYQITLKNRNVEEANFIIKDSGTTGKIIQTSNNNRAMFQTDASSATAKINLTIDGGKYVANQQGGNGGLFYGSNDGNENNIIIKNATVDSYRLLAGNINNISIDNLTLSNPYAYENSNLDVRLYDNSTKTYADILGSKSEAVIIKSDNSEVEIPSYALVSQSPANIYSGGEYNDKIVIRQKEGFKIDNIKLDTEYGYSTLPSTLILITNRGTNPLQIKNISVNDGNFEIEGTGTPTVDSKDTNTDFRIKAKSGLSVGTYNATIKVIDIDDNEYTATVTLVVDKKEINDYNITMESWTYGDTAKDFVIDYGTSLITSDVRIKYANADSEDWTMVKPSKAGKYKVKLQVVNENYIAEDKIANFEIFVNDTEIKIVPKSKSWTYDGNEHSEANYEVWYNGTKLDDYTLPNNSGYVEARIKGTVKDVQDTLAGNNVVDNYTIVNGTGCFSNIKVETGTLTITPITIPIVVTAKSDTKTYDGNDLTNDGYTYTDGVLLAGDTLTATVTGSQKYVGTSDNEVSDVKVMRDTKDITSNYTFGTHEKGTLTVEAAERNFEINDVNVLVGEHLSYSELKDKLNLTVYTHKNPSFKKVSGDGTYDITAGFNAPSTAGTTIMEITLYEEDLNDDGVMDYKEVTKEFKVIASEKETVTISGLTDNQEFTFDNTTKTPWGTGTITVEGNKVDVNELEIFYNGTGSTTYSSKFAPVDAGTYTITYKVKDSNPNYVGSVTYAFTIKKAQLNKPTASTTSFVYDGTSKGYSSFHDSEMFEFTGTNTAKNVGNYSFTISLKDKDNYEWIDGTTTDVVIDWSIIQATPDYTVPTGLIGVKGDFLKSIELPYGFTWNNPNELLNAGTHTYKATYTPEDTINYKVIDDIDITVLVKNKFLLTGIVSGGNGTISPSILEVLEGEKAEVTFTPDEGYMIDKVLVEGTEVQVTNNKLELTMDGHKLVSVSYKKIPFKITVKNVKGANVNPNGALSVNYGDTQEFTITINSGYKLVKVLVNGVDKTSEMIANKLTLTNITSDMTLEVVVEKITYKVVEGAEQKYVITKNTEAKFKIDADYSLFENGGKVYVDGVLLDAKNYKSESGSTIITLNKNYVDTLSNGEHTLKVVFSDGGEATTKFFVENVKTAVENPNTSDNIIIYVVTGILSLLGLTSTMVFVYRRKQTN